MSYLRLLFSVLCVICSTQADFKKVCYFPNWGQYRTGNGAFFPENIDTSLCTHIIYAFARLSSNQLGPIEWNDESTSTFVGMYKRFTNLKSKNPALKTMLAVGGGNAGTYEMSNTISSSVNRASFIKQAIKYLRDRNFDGLDLDFEFPGVVDRPYFTLLIQELRAAFNAESTTSGLPTLLLSVALPPDQARLDAGYQLSVIQSYLDFVGIMTYDYHGYWDLTINHNSPLFSSDTLNMNWSASYVASKGVAPSKIVIGMPFYGRGYTLANPNNYVIGSAASGASPAGPYSQTAGILFYYEICSIYLSDPNTAVYWSDAEQVTYLVNGNVWIGYDDKRSLARKVDYLKGKGFGGWMVWELSEDDFNAKFCTGHEVYPLLTLLNTQSFSNVTTVTTKLTTQTTRTTSTAKITTLKTTTIKPITTTARIATTTSSAKTTIKPGATQTITTKTSAATTTPPKTTLTTRTTKIATTTTKATTTLPNQNNICSIYISGLFPDPSDCTRFIQCSNFHAYYMNCPATLYFNPLQSYCDWSYNLSYDRQVLCGLI